MKNKKYFKASDVYKTLEEAKFLLKKAIDRTDRILKDGRLKKV